MQISKIFKKNNGKQLLIYGVVTVFAILGSYLLVSAYAAIFAATGEAEQGTLKSPAKLQPDSSASAGNAVKFGPVSPPPPHPTVKLMPLGDSITNGLGYSSAFGGYGGYRVLLWQKLVQTDHDAIDFVGSAQNGPSDLGDHDVEGHDGWTIDGGGTTALAPLIDGWMATFRPDIILLHAGTNDLRFGADGATTAARLDKLLGKIYTNSPNVKVIVAQPVRIRTGDQTLVTNQNNYAAAIPGVADKYRALGHSIQVINMLDLLDYYDGDYSDGIHPSAHGYDKMALAWYTLVSALYQSL